MECGESCGVLGSILLNLFAVYLVMVGTERDLMLCATLYRVRRV